MSEEAVLMIDEGFRRYLIQFQEWTKSYCAPVFFRDDSDQLRNGSMTFVNTGQEVLGITAGHVADRVKECCDGRPGHGCQVGGAELDHGRLIARHPILDLATFRLSATFVITAGLHGAASVTHWPPLPPVDGEKLLFGGYPGIYRKENEAAGQYDVTFAHFGVSASSVHEDRFAIGPLGIAEAFSLGGDRDRIPPQVDLGGMSGGGVFRVIESGLIARPEVLGIVYGGYQPFEVVLAHPLSVMKQDGTFIE